jgi:hypothetical protein
MIIEVGNFGITNISGEYSASIKKMIICKNMIVETIELYPEGKIRINKTLISCNNIDNALKLFDVIHTIFIGSRYDKLNRILKDV